MKKERKEVMDILYKYKKASSLRDEIGTCPNIEVEIGPCPNIEVRIDKSPFYKTLSCKGRRQGTNRQRNEMFMLLRHIERRLFSLLYPSYVNQQQSQARQKSSHRCQAFKCQNSQK